MKKFLMTTVFLLIHQSVAHAAEGEELEFLNILNNFRYRLSISRLNEDSILNQSSKNHAVWMAGKGRLTHSGPGIRTSSDDRIRAAGSTDWSTGENIARGSFRAKATFQQWFFSPSHLKLMLAPRYNKIGVARAGCASESDQWNCFWVTDFRPQAKR